MTKNTIRKYRVAGTKAFAPHSREPGRSHGKDDGQAPLLRAGDGSPCSGCRWPRSSIKVGVGHCQSKYSDYATIK
jgi:hypothetical protein